MAGRARQKHSGVRIRVQCEIQTSKVSCFNFHINSVMSECLCRNESHFKIEPQCFPKPNQALFFPKPNPVVFFPNPNIVV